MLLMPDLESEKKFLGLLAVGTAVFKPEVSSNIYVRWCLGLCAAWVVTLSSFKEG
jgi:hypothetical protein